MCKKLGVHDFIMSLPMGYYTILSEEASNLSGGQRQKLAIARAVFRNPKILVMDEATSNLDYISEKNIERLLRELLPDITIIMITHRIDTIKAFDAIYVMDGGEIVEVGTHESLFLENGVYKEMYEKNDII